MVPAVQGVVTRTDLEGLVSSMRISTTHVACMTTGDMSLLRHLLEHHTILISIPRLMQTRMSIPSRASFNTPYESTQAYHDGQQQQQQHAGYAHPQKTSAGYAHAQTGSHPHPHPSTSHHPQQAQYPSHARSQYPSSAYAGSHARYDVGASTNSGQYQSYQPQRTCGSGGERGILRHAFVIFVATLSGVLSERDSRTCASTGSDSTVAGSASAVDARRVVCILRERGVSIRVW